MMNSKTSESTKPVVPRRRWLKVDLDEQTFVRMHDSANRSRMKVSTYIRTMLDEGYVYNDVKVPFAAGPIPEHSSESIEAV